MVVVVVVVVVVVAVVVVVGGGVVASVVVGNNGQLASSSPSGQSRVPSHSWTSHIVLPLMHVNTMSPRHSGSTAGSTAAAKIKTNKVNNIHFCDSNNSGLFV